MHFFSFSLRKNRFPINPAVFFLKRSVLDQSMGFLESVDGFWGSVNGFWRSVNWFFGISQWLGIFSVPSQWRDSRANSSCEFDDGKVVISGNDWNEVLASQKCFLEIKLKEEEAKTHESERDPESEPEPNPQCGSYLMSLD